MPGVTNAARLQAHKEKMIIESLLDKVDSLALGLDSVLEVPDDSIDRVSLERIGLAIIVPSASKKLLKSPLVAVEAHDYDITIDAM